MARGRKVSDSVTVRLKKLPGEKNGKLLKSDFKYSDENSGFSDEFKTAAVHAYGRAIAKKQAQRILLSAGPIVQVNQSFVLAAIKSGKSKTEALKIAEMQHSAVNSYRAAIGKNPLPFLTEVPKAFEYSWKDSQAAFDLAQATGESPDDEDSEDSEDSEEEEEDKE